MTRFFAVALVVLAWLALPSCGAEAASTAGVQPESPSAPPVDADPQAEPSGEWVLVSLVVQGDVAIPLPGQPVDLVIADNQLNGSTGCNQLGGDASFAADGTVRIGELFWTEMACDPQSVMEFESLYTQSMLAVEGWAIVDHQLELRGAASQMNYVRRVAPADLPLTGTRWNLDTFFDGAAATNSPAMDGVSITFTTSGVRASGRCWTIEGFATVEPGGQGNLSVDFSSADPGFSCEDRGLFTSVMERLNQVSDYEINEHRLTLGAGGNPVLGFTSQSPPVPGSAEGEPTSPERATGSSGSGPEVGSADSETEFAPCDFEFIGEDITGNRSDGLPTDRLQVVAFYDGTSGSSPELRIELVGGSWLTVGGDSAGGSIEGFGRSIETREYRLYGCTPTGTVEVLGVQGNGVVDGLAFGMVWRHHDGGLVMLKSNPHAGIGAAAYVGMWPLGFSQDVFIERTPQITDSGGRESARTIVTGAALLENGVYSLALSPPG